MQTGLDIGIDVASKTLVAACAAGSFAPCPLRNERGALRKWLGELPEGSRIGMEATGSYHQLVADLAHAAGHCVYVLNARDVTLRKELEHNLRHQALRREEVRGGRGSARQDGPCGCTDHRSLHRARARPVACLCAVGRGAAAPGAAAQAARQVGGGAGGVGAGLERCGRNQSGTGGAAEGACAAIAPSRYFDCPGGGGSAGGQGPGRARAHHTWLW